MRDYLIIVGLALLAVFAGVAILSYRAANRVAPSAPAPLGTSVAFTVLASGTESNVTRRTNYLVTTDGGLRQLWKMLDGSGETPPSVDFTKSAVIAVFAGIEPTAGYEITVTGIRDAAPTRAVSVLINAPGVTCLAAQTQTTPYQVLLVPATDLSWTHADTATTTSCVP